MADQPPAPLPTDTASKALAEAFKTNFGGSLSDPIPAEALPTREQRAGITGGAPPAPTGPTGATAAGPTGDTGPTGAGDTGPTGATAAGPTGDTGPTGATAAGPTGATAAGPTGATGASKDELDAAGNRMGLKEGTAFRIVRADNDRLEGENTQLQASLAERDTLIAQLKANQADSEELIQLRDKVAKQDATLAVIHYEGTAEFQTAKQGLDRAESEIAEITGSYGLSPADVSKVLAETDPVKRRQSIRELTKEFQPYDAAALVEAIRNREASGAQVTNLRAQATDRLKTMRAADAEAARTQMEAVTKNWKSALDISVGQLSKEVPITNPTGDEKWDADIKGGLDRVKALNIAQMKDEDIALRFYKSEMLSPVLKLVKSLTTDLLAAQDRVAKLQGGTPPAGGGAPPPPTPPKTGPDQGASFLKTLKELLPETGMPK